MPIDNCDFSFSELATSKLPTHMKAMTEALQEPREMSLFSQNGVGKLLSSRCSGSRKISKAVMCLLMRRLLCMSAYPEA